MGKKHNQSKSKFSYKNDESELVLLGQFLRDSFPDLIIEREWFILFDGDGSVLRVQSNQPPRHLNGRITGGNPFGISHRNPDIMVFAKCARTFNRGKLICCIEVDGSIHDKKIWATEKRNIQYRDAKIKLIVINKMLMDRNILDEVFNKLKELLNS